MKTFTEWFTKQHGKRPGDARMSDEDLELVVRRGNAARAMLEKRALYDAMERSALYAWQAAAKEKSE